MEDAATPDVARVRWLACALLPATGGIVPGCVRGVGATALVTSAPGVRSLNGDSTEVGGRDVEA